MRNILIVLTLILSCNTYRCCRQPFEDVYTSHITNRYGKGDICAQDEFHASTLIGIWQFDYNVSVGVYSLYEVEFFNDGYCDITLGKKGETYRYDMTFKWSYNNSYINFDSGNTYDERLAFSFKKIRYLYPTLTIEDSFGTYEMKKLS